MTVIAWDGKTLAADKRATGSHVYTVSKLFRSGEYIVGCSGEADQVGAFRAWFDDGRDPATYPKNDDRKLFMLAVHVSGRIERYETTAWPITVESRFCAMGSGQPYAMAAMHLGCDAMRAVLVACEFDEGCGNGVDTLRHE